MNDQKDRKQDRHKPGYKAAYDRARRADNREFIADIRSKTVCEQCGAQPIDWHNPEHLTKPYRRLGRGMHRESRPQIVREIKASVALCRRCHMNEDGRLQEFLSHRRPFPKSHLKLPRQKAEA